MRWWVHQTPSVAILCFWGLGHTLASCSSHPHTAPGFWQSPTRARFSKFVHAQVVQLDLRAVPVRGVGPGGLFVCLFVMACSTLMQAHTHVLNSPLVVVRLHARAVVPKFLLRFVESYTFSTPQY